MSKIHPRIYRASGHSSGVRFPLSVKMQAVALRKTGMAVFNIAKECNTSTSSVNEWLKQHKEGNFNEPIAFQRNCKMIRS